MDLEKVALRKEFSKEKCSKMPKNFVLKLSQVFRDLTRFLDTHCKSHAFYRGCLYDSEGYFVLDLIVSDTKGNVSTAMVKVDSETKQIFLDKKLKFYERDDVKRLGKIVYKLLVDLTEVSKDSVCFSKIYFENGSFVQGSMEPSTEEPGGYIAYLLTAEDYDDLLSGAFD